MKKLVSLLTIGLFISHASLRADEIVPPEAVHLESVENYHPPTASIESQNTQQTAGIAAAKTSDRGRNTSWQNWVFAGTALALAAIGILAVTFNSGENSPTHQ